MQAVIERKFHICGVDEAGRGPLAGPVYAAAVILDPARPIAGLNDSKKLTEKARDRLAFIIKAEALAWHIAYATVEEIDRLNILQATMLAMTRAVEGLKVQPEEVLVDGNRCPDWSYVSKAIIEGDAKVAEISAASILAKTARDAAMVELHERYPHYNFAGHKGYGTAAHLKAIKQHGPCPEHRRSFAPVREILTQGVLY
ncbi:MAG: ribonuclease HII [Hydrogenophilaceae bacterium]|nr:ribonuclease HII [Hydrogenophilaceae bacterium]